MTTAHLWFAVAGETMLPPRAPFLRAWGTSRFPSLLNRHRLRGGR